ncbi:MAG: DUF2637 domain-containing protein [Pseudonocardiaceae bacterium]
MTITPVAGPEPAPLSPAVRVVTVVAVVVVAVIAAVVSYSHLRQLAERAGEAWRSSLVPLSIDGLVVAASMVLLTRRRTGLPGGPLAWGALGGGVLASLAANMADAQPDVTAVLVAGWPAVAFAVAFELLLQQRRAQDTVPPPPAPAPVTTPDPTPELALEPLPQRYPTVSGPAVAAVPVDPAPLADSAAGPVGGEELLARVRGLLAEARAQGRRVGRRAVAAELGVSEHQARVALDLLDRVPHTIDHPGDATR